MISLFMDGVTFLGGPRGLFALFRPPLEERASGCRTGRNLRSVEKEAFWAFGTRLGRPKEGLKKRDTLTERVTFSGYIPP